MSSISPIDKRCGEKLPNKCLVCKDDFGNPFSTGDMKTCDRCGGKSEHGGYCVNYPTTGNTKCRMHGGASITAYSGGKYSKHIPPRLLQRYEDFQNNPDRLSMQAEIDLLDARVTDILDRTETEKSGEKWKELHQTFNNFLDARAARDSDLMAHYLEKVYTIIKAGKSDYQAWTEVSRLWEQRRKLVETEQKRIVMAQQVATVDEVVGLVGEINKIIQEEVKDLAIKERISQRILERLRRG